jgi:phosphoglycerate dehydrogenase-like enzyme
VQSFDLFPMAEEQAKELDIKQVSLEELFRTSDIISCHTPLTDDTRHIVNAERLAMMKPSAVIINTSRGPVVDEQALIEALQQGKIAGAGVDVFEVEPVAQDNPLLKMDNVVLTPHTAGTTWDTWFRRAQFAYENMERVWNGEAPQAIAQTYDIEK